MNRRREVERFKVKSEFGNEYTVITYQEFIPTKTLNDPYGEIKGLKELITTTGLHVNYIDSETFLIVATNETVKKI